MIYYERIGNGTPTLYGGAIATVISSLCISGATTGGRSSVVSCIRICRRSLRRGAQAISLVVSFLRSLAVGQ